MKIQRTLPPTAAPLPLSDLFHGLAGTVLGDRHLKRLKSEMKRNFGVTHVFLVSSGKAALTLILRALASLSPKRQILIPAYTCFSVPSAIVKAGLDVSLCDVDPATLDFDFDLLERSVTQDTLCVVATHLLGLPSNVERVKTICERRGVFVVEDAAQAMGGTYQGRPLGSVGDAGFFSLGRGKNITCGSGGIVLTNSEIIAPALQRGYEELPSEPVGYTLRSLVNLAAMWLFMRPSLYWFPSSLPFLHLGETIFCPEFPEWKLGHVKASLLSGWHRRLRWSNRIRRRGAQKLSDQLCLGLRSGSWDSPAPPIPLRLPFLLETPEEKRELCRISRRQGLGISPMYPTAIDAIPALAGRFRGNRYPGASAVANRLVTLPVHHLVNSKDVERISQVTREFAGTLPGVSPEPVSHPAVPALI